MLARHLMNLDVEVSISEPWSFGEGKETSPFNAIIEQVSIKYHSRDKKLQVSESVLLRVARPFAYRNVKCEFLLASPRHVGIGLHNLVSGEHVPFNFLRISSDRACSDDPFCKRSEKWHEKTFGLIGTLSK
jgi:hypothetical protein